MKEYYKTKTDPKERQHRETPHEIVTALVSIYGCQIDLAATRSNRRLFRYCSEEEGDPNEGWRGNALEVDWSLFLKHADTMEEDPEYLRVGFCNPPYRDIRPWLAKAAAEADKGFTSVFLIPTFNGEKWNRLAMDATEIVLLENRISFILPSTGQPDPGNNRGSMLCVFRPTTLTVPALSYMNTRELLTLGGLRCVVAR